MHCSGTQFRTLAPPRFEPQPSNATSDPGESTLSEPKVIKHDMGLTVTRSHLFRSVAVVLVVTLPLHQGCRWYQRGNRNDMLTDRDLALNGITCKTSGLKLYIIREHASSTIPKHCQQLWIIMRCWPHAYVSCLTSELIRKSIYISLTSDILRKGSMFVCAILEDG